jgi:hypothetical protein
MSDFVQIYSRDGLPMRPLVMGQVNRVEAIVEVEGSTSVQFDAATFEVAKSGVTQSYSIAGGGVTVSGNELYVDISSSVISSTLAANELEVLNGAWSITINGSSAPVQFEEVFFVTRKSIACPLRTRDLIERYPLLGTPNAYPIDPSTGLRQTSWAPQIRLAWQELVEWFALQGREKAPWMICNCMALRNMTLWSTIMVISRMNMNGLSNQIWNFHLADASERLSKAQASTLAYYQAGGRNRFGEQPSMNRGPVEDPKLMTGTVSDEDFGKW